MPLLKEAKQKKVGNLFRKALTIESKSRRTLSSEADELAALDIDGEMARDQLAHAKPPK